MECQRIYLIGPANKIKRAIIDKYGQVFYPGSGGWTGLSRYYKVKYLPGFFKEDDLFWEHHKMGHDAFHDRFTKSWLYFGAK